MPRVGYIEVFRERSGLLMQIGLFMTAVLGAAVFYFMAVLAVMNGLWWLAGCAVLIVSPLGMALLRHAYEYPFRLDRSFVNPKVMSRAFVFGDFILLPAALMLAAQGWSKLHTELAGSVVFLFVVLAIGYAAALVFTLMDGKRYIDAGVPSARFSPSKLWHDWAVMPGVVAILIWTLLPQLSVDKSPPETLIAIMALLGFVGLVMADNTSPVNPRHQHPVWDVENFQVPAPGAPLWPGIWSE